MKKRRVHLKLKGKKSNNGGDIGVGKGAEIFAPRKKREKTLFGSVLLRGRRENTKEPQL